MCDALIVGMTFIDCVVINLQNVLQQKNLLYFVLLWLYYIQYLSFLRICNWTCTKLQQNTKMCCSCEQPLGYKMVHAMWNVKRWPGEEVKVEQRDTSTGKGLNTMAFLTVGWSLVYSQTCINNTQCRMGFESAGTLSQYSAIPIFSGHFSSNAHERHLIACLKGWCIFYTFGSLYSEQSFSFVLSCSAQYRAICNCNISTLISRFM